MIYVKIQGGLGNQMFQYAFARNLSLINNEELTLDIRNVGIKSHEKYALDKLNIKDTKIIDSGEIKLGFSTRVVYKILQSKYFSNKRIKFEKKHQKFLNKYGLYSNYEGYVKAYKSKMKLKYVDGYFQSKKCFEENFDIIKEELKTKEPILSRNQEYLNKITSTESVCVHIRRGDYTKVVNHLVCNKNYYIKAMNLMNNKLKKPKFYIFSDDIKWVKENIKFPSKVTYIEGENPNYEELRLMYSCKHFIISNSSFSWWAQLLSDNKDKIVVSPNIWFRKKGQKTGLLEDSFIKIKVGE